MEAMFRPVKTAVVGCGKISSIYLRNLTELVSIIDVVAVCDRAAAAAERQAKRYGISRILTLEEIAADPDIELVVVLTGPQFNYSVLEMMLKAGKHVYTEKTIAADLEHGRALLDLAKQCGRYIGGAPDTVLGAGIQTARKVLDSGLIGTPTSFLISINRNHSLNAEEFVYLQRSESVSFPYDVGVYYIAAILALLGPAKEVNAMAAPAPLHERELLFKEDPRTAFTLPGYNILTGSMEMANGCIGSVHFNGASVNEEQDYIIIFGTEGILQMNDNNGFNGRVRLIRSETGECVIPHTHGYDGTAVLEDLDPAEEAGYGHRGIGAAEMAWAIRQGRPARCSGEFAFHTLEVLEGMRTAAREKRNYGMTSSFEMKPLRSGHLSTIFHGWLRGDAELSLKD